MTAKQPSGKSMREIESDTFKDFDGVPGLRPLTETEAAELDAYHEHVRDHVVPVIAAKVSQREKDAVEARKLISF
ncbi:hypothetical protein [Paraburkholderia youngii]|uniref:hypothetical protein n=1 Tax=Paraburkholderia youngii TaxID=2782701 RepID=UPI003D210942